MEEIKLQIQSNISDLLKEIKNLNAETNKLSAGYKNLSQSVSNSNNSLRSASQNWQKINEISKQYEEQSKMAGKADEENWNNGIKKINEYYNSYKKLVSNIGTLSLRMAGSIKTTAMGMTPISPSEFSSGFSLNPKTLFGFGDAMKNAFGMMKEMQQMRHDLAYLSNDAGDAGKALSTVFDIAGGSAISRTTSQGVVRALADQGLRLTDSAGKASPKIKELGILAGNLQAATGIAGSQWGSFTGELDFNYGLSAEGLGSITSAMVGTGLGAQQLERVITATNKVLQNTAFIAGVPTEKAILGLSKSISGAMKVFNKFNIPAEKAATLIEGILDPENFQKNSYLFAKLGIGASEYASYLNDVNGQQMLLEKVMGNLPQLANEVANIQNPFARMEIAKSLGLDMQTVRKFATSSKAEIEQIMKEFVVANKNQEALDKKKKRMAAESAKFDDFIFGLKMKVLAPIMQMLQGGMLKEFMNIMPNLAGAMAKTFIAVAPVATMVMNGLLSVAPIVAGFIQRLGGAIGWIFSEKMGGAAGIVNFLDNKYQDVKNNGNSFLESIGDVFSILSKIYLAVKAVQIGKFFLDTAKSLGGFVGSAFNKAIGWIMPSKKLIINATVGDLAEAIGREVKPGLGGGAIPGGGFLSNILSSGLLALLGIGAGSLIFKMLFGSKEYKEINNLQNFGSSQGRDTQEKEAMSNFYKDIGERAFMYGGGATVLGGRMLYQGGKGAIQGAEGAAKIAYRSSLKEIALSTRELSKFMPMQGVTQTQKLSYIGGKTFDAGLEGGIKGFKAGAGITKGVGKAVASKIMLPVMAAMSVMDINEIFNSETTGWAYGLKTTGTLLNTAALGLTIAAMAQSATLVALPTGALTGILAVGAGIVGTTFQVIGDYLGNQQMLDKKKKELYDAFNLNEDGPNKALKNLIEKRSAPIEIATQRQSTTIYGGGSAQITSTIRSKETFDRLSAGAFATYEDYQKGMAERLIKDEETAKHFMNKDAILGKLKKEYSIDEEQFLKDKYAFAQLNVDQTGIEMQNEKLKQYYIKTKKINNTEAEALIAKDFENLEASKQAEIERRKILKMETTKTGELLNTLYKSFKVGNFSGIFEMLTIIFDKIKLTFLKIYASLPGFSTASAIELSKNIMGENFVKGQDFTSWWTAKIFEDEDKFKDFLDQQMVEKDKELGTARIRINEQNDTLAKQQDDEEKKRLTKENNKNIKENTDTIKQNTEAINKAKTESDNRIREVQVKNIIENFGGIKI